MIITPLADPPAAAVRAAMNEGIAALIGTVLPVHWRQVCLVPIDIDAQVLIFHALVQADSDDRNGGLQWVTPRQPAI